MRTIITAALALLPVVQAAAQTPMPADVQIASAVTPLPQEFRASATVLGYVAGSKALTQLRAGTGAFICLADDPAEERFHVACYHKALEPFMARGRELRAQGVTGAAVDSIRNSEIIGKKVPMPSAGTLYSLTGTLANVDVTTGAVTGARSLYVVYVPFATPETLGLPSRPSGNMPWIMLPGTPKAHIMFTPTM